MKKILLSELKPDPKNTRVHDNRNIKTIMDSLEKFGQYRPFVVQKRGMIIRVGNGMFEAMNRLGWTEGNAEIKDLNDKDAETLSVLDNRSSELATWDNALLAEIINELPEDLLAISGFSEAEIDEMINSFLPQTPIEEKEPIPEPPQKPMTEKGQIYQLGNHRLMCGDSSNFDDVKKLMDSSLADMVFTDPPYGVSYTGKTKDALKIKSDNLNADQLAEINKKWFDCIDGSIRPGAYVLATVPAGPLHLIFAKDWLDRGWLRQIMVWNKDSMVLGHSEYHYKHEPILFGWKEGGERLKCADRTKTTVWDFLRPKASREHPTMKPVEMWVYAIKNHSLKGNLLYEPFGGSGTTLIACEQTGRQCYAMELDPRYCDVIIERYCNFKKIDPGSIFNKNKH